MDQHKKVVGGEVEAHADVTEAPTGQRGALVEDSEVAGTVRGGVETKDPGGKIHEGRATDRREQG